MTERHTPAGRRETSARELSIPATRAGAYIDGTMARVRWYEAMLDVVLYERTHTA
jgi:hypothetical protein